MMRGEGAPPTAVRAVVAGGLCYLDAELLNALVLRRDCCSVSAVKALQVCFIVCTTRRHSTPHAKGRILMVASV